ncbi:hypothetical protein PENTCL1PPCAC_11558, partial [Pristionchus entomophagus]
MRRVMENRENVSEALSIIDERVSKMKSEFNPSNMEEVLVLNIHPMFAEFVKVLMSTGKTPMDSPAISCSFNDEVNRMKGEISRLSCVFEVMRQLLSHEETEGRGKGAEREGGTSMRPTKSASNQDTVEREADTIGEKEEPLRKKPKIEVYDISDDEIDDVEKKSMPKGKSNSMGDECVAVAHPSHGSVHSPSQSTPLPLPGSSLFKTDVNPSIPLPFSHKLD